MVGRYPEVAEGSSNDYQAWEVVDPDKWVPDGYAILRIDSRKNGTESTRLPGLLQRARDADYYDCIEWAASRRGRTARSGWPASRTTPSTSGRSHRSAPPTSLLSASGKGRPTGIARCATTVGSGPLRRTLVREAGGKRSIWLRRTRRTLSAERPPSNWRREPGRRGACFKSRRSLARRRRTPVQRRLPPRAIRPSGRDRDPAAISRKLGADGIFHSRGNFNGYTNAASPQKWLESPRRRPLDILLYGLWALTSTTVL